MNSSRNNSPAASAIQVIHEGNVASLEQLLKENASLAMARVDGKRTLLHAATDWPGHFPDSRETVSKLIEHGAEVDAAFVGEHSETPLHCAASSDDVTALDALLDHGVQIEARGGVIGGGTPLADEGWQTAPEFCHPRSSARKAARRKLRIVSGQWMSGLAARNVVVLATGL